MRFLPVNLISTLCVLTIHLPVQAQDEVIGKIGTLEIKASEIRKSLATLSEPELQTMKEGPRRPESVCPGTPRSGIGSP